MALGVVFLVHGHPFGNGESIGNRIPLSKIRFFLMALRNWENPLFSCKGSFEDSHD